MDVRLVNRARGLIHTPDKTPTAKSALDTMHALSLEGVREANTGQVEFEVTPSFHEALLAHEADDRLTYDEGGDVWSFRDMPIRPTLPDKPLATHEDAAPAEPKPPPKAAKPKPKAAPKRGAAKGVVK